MIKLLLPLLAIFSLSSCSESGKSGFDTADGKKFAGIWKNPNQTVSQANQFVIDDRILIENKSDNRYSVSVLARGVFTEMQYNPKDSLLCTLQNSGKACFKLEDENTLIVGSETGFITYKRIK